LSELRHVQRGATWRNSRHWCGGREATLAELPSCYSGESWKGVTLDQFMACPNNLAHNRFVLKFYTSIASYLILSIIKPFNKKTSYIGKHG
jgi:hypothetical protein